MNEAVIAALVIFGLIGLAQFAWYVDKRKSQLKGVQPRVEVYPHKKRKPSIMKGITNFLTRLYSRKGQM